MQKLTAFLEKNVEWVALGLGGLWLLYVGYAYFMSNPIGVRIEGTKLVPAGEVDQVVDKQVDKLKQRMEDKAPNMPLKDPVKAFADTINNTSFQPTVLAGVWVNSPAGKVGGTTPPPPPPKEDLASSPKVPPTTLVGVVSGRSLIMPPTPAAGGAAPVVPVGGAGAAQALGVDRDWTSVFVALDELLLAQAYEAAKIPAQARVIPPTVLMVQLEREELLPNGQWGKSTIVRPLANNPKGPTELPTAADAQVAYVNALKETATQDAVVRPPFHPIVGGDQWGTPDQPRVKPVGDHGASTPAVTPPPADTPNAGKKGPNTGKKGGNTPRGEGGTSKGGKARPAMYIEDPVAARIFFEVPAPAAAGQGAKGTLYWAHDDSREPGKTYRYRARILILNPLYQSSKVAADPADEKVLALPTKPDEGWSEWSQPVTTDLRERFFVARVPGMFGKPRTYAVVRLYRFQAGKWAMEEVNVAAGDPLGSTDWTVVDIRPVRGGADDAVIAINPEGRQEMRLARADKDAEDAFRREVGLNPPPAAAPIGAPINRVFQP